MPYVKPTIMNNPRSIALLSTSTLIAVFLNTGCDKSPTPNQSSTSTVKAATPLPPMSLDAQASAQAKEHLESVWLKRGDLYYAVAGSGGQESLNPRRLVEAKGLSFQVQAIPLTPADKLNGLEWSGVVACQFTASRSKPLNSGAWGDWQNGVFFGDGEGENQYELQKKSGQWKIERAAFVSAQRPAPTQLP